MKPHETLTALALFLSISGVIATSFLIAQQTPQTVALDAIANVPDHTRIQTQARIDKISFSIHGTKLWLTNPYTPKPILASTPEFLEIPPHTLIRFTAKVIRKQNQVQLEILQVTRID